MSKHSDLEKNIGYAFRDEKLVDMALTHASLQKKDCDNERLEFLGDRVLGLAIAGMLYRAYPDETEGSLAKRLTALVQQAALVSVGTKLGLEALIRVSGSAKKDAILADGTEALVGAVFIDGGYDAAAQVITKLWNDMLESHLVPPEDAKTKLQEWAQSKGFPLPEYKVISRTGEDHAPMFEVSVSVEKQGSASAMAASKRAAEKEAAAKMLDKIAGNA